MVWVELAIAIMSLIEKLPGIVAELKEIFGMFPKHPVAATAEARRMLPAVKAKLASCGPGVVAGPSPIATYKAELRERRDSRR